MSLLWLERDPADSARNNTLLDSTKQARRRISGAVPFVNVPHFTAQKCPTFY